MSSSRLQAAVLAVGGTIVLALACMGGPEATPERASARAGSAAAQAKHCLALSMYWEAKAEGREGMRAVGHVVMNRVADPRFANDPCAVVYAGGETPPCQFSWYCDGKSDRPTEKKNWAVAEELADQLLAGKLRDTTKGALFFHAARIKIPWAVKRERTKRIGNHIFYR